MVNQTFSVVTGSEYFRATVFEFSANSRRWENGTVFGEACIPFYQLGLMIYTSTRTRN